jgi:hypothetical protein
MGAYRECDFTPNAFKTNSEMAEKQADSKQTGAVSTS